jgi:hypothetical protein
LFGPEVPGCTWPWGITQHRGDTLQQSPIAGASGLGGVKGLGLSAPALAPQTHGIAAGAELARNLLVAPPLGGVENGFGPPHETLRAGLTSNEVL